MKPVKKHVITGGPCTGKTTTVQALAKQGFPIVEEASRILIEEQNKIGGDLVPWKRLMEFNIAVTKLQLSLESRAQEGTHFLDRGVIDNIAYCEWGNIQPPKELLTAVDAVEYEHVFLLRPLPHFEQDDVRKESSEEGVKLTTLIKKAYTSRGYDVVELPPVSVQKRVDLILNHIEKER